MDEKLSPDLNNIPTEGQTDAPELTWQDAAATAQPAAEAASETVADTTEAATETAETECDTAETAETVCDTAETAVDTSVSTATSGFTPADAAVATPKKPVGLLVTIGVLVVAIVAVIAIFLNQPPEKAVHTALDTTEKAMMARAEKIAQEMPALNEMNQPAKATKSNFAFTFEGIQTAEGGTETAMVSNLLKGIGLRGNLVSDPSNSIFEMDANLGLAETPVFDFYMMMNPDTFAFGMPMCSDTMLSLAPSTLKADFIASPMYANILKTYEGLSPEYKDEFVTSMDTQLEMLQSMLVAQVENLKMTSNAMELSKSMQTEMMEHISPVYEGATYTKMPKEGALKVYQVELQGAQVRKMIVDLAKYIYLDSEIMNSYDSMFTPEMLGGKSYKELMQEQLIQPLEENLPDLPTTLLVKVDGKKIIRSMLITVNLPESQNGDDVKVTKLTADFTFGDDQTVEMNIDCEAVELISNESVGLKMNMKETYIGDLYDTSMNMVMQMGAAQSVTMDMLMAANKDGKLNVTASMGMDDSYMPMNLKLAMDGGVKKDSENTIWEYPSIICSIEQIDASGVAQALGNITFGYRSESTPLAGAFAPARAANAVFKMTAEELEAEMGKYETKLSETIQQFSALMGNTMPAPEIAPIPPEDMPQDTTSGLDQLTPEENEKLVAYITSLSDEQLEEFMNLSEEDAYALIQEIISQPAA